MRKRTVDQDVEGMLGLIGAMRRSDGGRDTMQTKQKRYKWDSPHAWLMHKVNKTRTTRSELIGFIDSLAGRLDSDSIQDLFEAEMDADGYFRALKD